MRAHGIEFGHRRSQSDESSLEYAQFMTFAALCASEGVASVVRSVFFDTKWQGFTIEALPVAEGGPRHQAVKRCAERALPQFILYGAYGLWDRAEPMRPDDGEYAW